MPAASTGKNVCVPHPPSHIGKDGGTYSEGRWEQWLVRTLCLNLLVLAGWRFSLTAVHEAHVDQKNKVVTTPAFMCETALHHIYDGIGAMVTKVLELSKK